MEITLSSAEHCRLLIKLLPNQQVKSSVS